MDALTSKVVEANSLEEEETAARASLLASCSSSETSGDDAMSAKSATSRLTRSGSRHLDNHSVNGDHVDDVVILSDDSESPDFVKEQPTKNSIKVKPYAFPILYCLIFLSCGLS